MSNERLGIHVYMPLHAQRAWQNTRWFPKKTCHKSTVFAKTLEIPGASTTQVNGGKLLTLRNLEKHSVITVWSRKYIYATYRGRPKINQPYIAI